MIEKDYYGLDELEKRFGLSISDLIYLIEDNKLDLVAKLKQQRFIIGGYKEQKFVGFAAVKYEGFATILRDQQIELLRNKQVSAKSFNLLNPSNIELESLTYPFERKTPNSFISDWNPIEPNKINWRTIPAKPFPDEQKHVAHFLKDALSDSLKLIKGKALKEQANPIDELPKTVISPKGIELSFLDVFLFHQQIESLGLVSSKKEITHEVITPDSIESTKLRNDDFNDLLKLMVEKKPAMTAKEYWRLLENEVEEFEGFREFDKYNLLIEITGSSLNWKDRNGKPRKPISFNAFANRLSKVRND